MQKQSVVQPNPKRVNCLVSNTITASGCYIDFAIKTEMIPPLTHCWLSHQIRVSTHKHSPKHIHTYVWIQYTLQKNINKRPALCLENIWVRSAIAFTWYPSDVSFQQSCARCKCQKWMKPTKQHKNPKKFNSVTVDSSSQLGHHIR